MDFYKQIDFRQKPDFIFNALAKELFTNYCLEVAGECFYFTELEFYYNGPEHADFFCHANPAQETPAEVLYFHGAGMDIVIGQTGKPGGALVRGVYQKGRPPISGPINVLNKALFPVLKVCPAGKYSSKQADCLKKQISLKRLANPESAEYWQGMRIGLGKRWTGDKDKEKTFRYAPYRYVRLLAGVPATNRDKERLEYVAECLRQPQAKKWTVERLQKRRHDIRWQALIERYAVQQ